MNWKIISLLFLTIALLGCTQQEPERDVVQEQQEPETKEPVIPDPIKKETKPKETMSTEEVKEFSMTAKKWEFIPETITVNKDDKVRLKITSIDVDHGIALPAFGVNEQLDPNDEITVEFVADKTGTFPFFCNVFCGSGHTHMEGTLIVE